MPTSKNHHTQSDDTNILLWEWKVILCFDYSKSDIFARILDLFKCFCKFRYCVSTFYSSSMALRSFEFGLLDN